MVLLIQSQTLYLLRRSLKSNYLIVVLFNVNNRQVFFRPKKEPSTLHMMPLDKEFTETLKLAF